MEAVFFCPVPIERIVKKWAGLTPIFSIGTLKSVLIIRLQRVGRRNDPWFRVVVTEKKGSPKGKYLEMVGSFDIRRGNAQLNKERILFWISKGSKPSPTVHNMLISQGIIEGKKIPKHKRVLVAQAQEASPAVASATETPAPQEETPAPEVSPEPEAPAAPEATPEIPAEETPEK